MSDTKELFNIVLDRLDNGLVKLKSIRLYADDVSDDLMINGKVKDFNLENKYKYIEQLIKDTGMYCKDFSVKEDIYARQKTAEYIKQYTIEIHLVLKK